MNTSTLVRAVRRIADVVAECNYAQRRMAALRASPDSYVIGKGQAPGDYAEFLFRTSGPLPHEPTAARRARGHLVR
jgi:hypothetical protein